MRRIVTLIAAVSVLCLGTLGAQTLQPMTAGVIPVVAHLPGAEGSFWTTTLYASQVTGNTPAQLSVTLLAPNGDHYEKTFTFPATGGTLEVKDVVKAVAPDLANGKYPVTWWATQKVVVSTRTFTTDSAGSYGQGVGSVAPGSGFETNGQVVFPAPMDFDGHRVAVGLANTGGTTQTFEIKTLDAMGSEINSWTKTVGPGALVQFRSNENMDSAGSISITCTDGCDGTAFAYASIVINGTSDPYFLYAGASAGAGPTEPIAVNRDAQGVWYITGGTLYDVFEAMGHEVATDRLWQMETYRRTARGTLAEILGQDYLQDDIFMRASGYSEAELQAAYDQLDTESKTVLRAYVDGINRRIAEIHKDPSQLPFEFRAIGGQLGIDFYPAPWTVTDVMSWMVALLRSFDPEGRGVTGQLDNAVMLQSFAQAYPNDYLAMFSDLRWRNDPAALTYVHDEVPEGSSNSAKVRAPSMPDLRAATARIEARHERRLKDLKRINAFTKMGSYAWVVSGKKTASGHPIIYSGPQMGFWTPSIVMEGSIRGAGLNISGMTVPAVPGIIIGRTPHHAWSMQVGHAHTLDFYLEPPSAVKLNRMETFHVAGGADVTVPIFRTAHGPVIEPIPYDPANPPSVIVSFKYSHWGYELKNVIQFALHAARATSMKQFGEAIALAPLSQHFCYADRDGNIAYWMSGRDPVRPANVDVRFPLPGDGTAEWDPTVIKPHPHSENTSFNYYGGWNNKAELHYDNPPNNLWYTMGVFHRAHVVDDYLKTHDNLTYEQVRDLSLNIATTDSFYGGGNPWKFVASRFESAVAANPSDSRNAAIALLQGWDGHFVDGGQANWVDGLFRADGWVLEDAWIREVLRLTFSDEFAGAGLDYTSQPLGLLFNVFLHALAGDQASVVNHYDWFQDRSGEGRPTTADGIIVQALDNVLAKLGPRPWHVARGYIHYVHPMLGEIHTTPFASRSTYAHCVEMGPSGPIRIESMFPLGESGTILMDEHGAPVFDPQFFGLTPFFDTFTHRTFPLFTAN